MTIEAGPPAQPPQLSPDHKWFWDGSAWRPVAQHEAVFRNWQSVGAGLPPEQTAPVQRIPSPPPMSRAVVPKVPAYVMPAPAPGVEVPLWKQGSTGAGVNRYLYFAGALVGLVIVAVILNSMGTISLPWPTTDARPTAAPTISGANDSARADSYANTLLAPRISAIEDSVTLASQTCGAGLTTSCQEAAIQIDNKTTGALGVMEGISVPFCIYPQHAALRADLTKLDLAAQAALKGFRDDRLAEMQSALGQIAAANNQVRADDAALIAAAKACGTSTVP